VVAVGASKDGLMSGTGRVALKLMSRLSIVAPPSSPELKVSGEHRNAMRLYRDFHIPVEG
jgi:hypothetical protein